MNFRKEFKAKKMPRKFNEAFLNYGYVVVVKTINLSHHLNRLDILLIYQIFH